MTSVDGLLKHIKAELSMKGDILTVYIPKNFSSMKARIKSAKEELLKEYGGRKLRIDDKKKEAVELKVNALDVTVLDSISDELVGLVDSNTHVGVDFETDSVDPVRAKIISVGLCFLNNKETFYIPMAHTSGDNVPIEVVMEFLKYAAQRNRFIVHNLAFEKKILERYDIHPEFDDSMILTYLKGGLRSNKLKEVVKHRLQERMTTFDEVTGTGKQKKRFEDVDILEAAQYCGSDAYYSAKLFDLLSPEVKTELINLDLDAAHVCSNMESRGVRIDTGVLKDIKRLCERRRDRIEKLIYATAGEEFNINSAQQLGKILYDKLNIEPDSKEGYTATGRYATGSKAIDALLRNGADNRILTHIKQYRNMVKIIGTYVNRILEGIMEDTNRYHPYFNFVGADTGRLSSDFQQLPASGIGGRVREAVIPPKGFKVVSADYSQIEVRLLAHLMQDETINKMIHDGVDLHTATASLLFDTPVEDIDKDGNERRIGKTFNFSIIYGEGDKATAEKLNMSLKEAKALRERYFSKFPKLKALMDDVLDFVRSNGYAETMAGRRRYLPDINLKPINKKAIGKIKRAKRQAFNAVIQGSAADLVRQVMPSCDRLALNYESELVLQVHDELVFYVPDKHVDNFCRDVKKTMEVNNICGTIIDVPIIADVGVGDNYAEAK